MTLTRRTFLARSIAAGAALGRFFEGAAAQAVPPGPVANGRFVRTVPLGRFDGRPTPPLGTLLGAGLDARQLNDVSTLTEDTLITSNERFFVRTAYSPSAHGIPGPWILRIGGRVRTPVDLRLDALEALAGPSGTHLLECAGNSDPASFGLISAAQWGGIPVGAVLDRVQPLPGPWRVLISGIDPIAPSRTSLPGASWIFSRDDLERSGAFFATAMNGMKLPSDHGFPVRLVVPRWYGCACIKWVSRIDLTPDDEPATPQMREFAARTHQNGVPARAHDYEPAVIDCAAMPIRVEQWTIDGRTEYRVVGVIWGGSRPTDALTIRFKHNQPFVRVDHYAVPESTSTWSLWSHRWRPDVPGRYQIALRVSDPAIRTRRLDVFYYTREVQVDEV